jgi:hypothetical protein
MYTLTATKNWITVMENVSATRNLIPSVALIQQRATDWYRRFEAWWEGIHSWHTVVHGEIKTIYGYLFGGGVLSMMEQYIIHITNLSNCLLALDLV